MNSNFESFVLAPGVSRVVWCVSTFTLWCMRLYLPLLAAYGLNFFRVIFNFDFSRSLTYALFFVVLFPLVYGWLNAAKAPDGVSNLLSRDYSFSKLLEPSLSNTSPELLLSKFRSSLSSFSRFILLLLLNIGGEFWCFKPYKYYTDSKLNLSWLNFLLFCYKIGYLITGSCL